MTGPSLAVAGIRQPAVAGSFHPADPAAAGPKALGSIANATVAPQSVKS